MHSGTRDRFSRRRFGALALAIAAGGCSTRSPVSESGARLALAPTTTSSARRDELLRSDPWRVGVYLSFTGDLGAYGLEAKEGIELAVEEINAAGGVKGRPITLYFADVYAIADTTDAVTDLIDRDRVIALIGDTTSAKSKLGAIVANQKRVPMITPSATANELTDVGPFVFRACVVDPAQGAAAAEFMVKRLGKKKLGLMVASQSYSSSLASTFKAAVQGYGGSILVERNFSGGEAVFSGHLAEVARAQVEMIYAPVYYDQMIQIARQAKALNIPHDMFMGGDGFADATLFKELEGGYFTDHYALDIPWKKSKAFISAYEERWSRRPTPLSALGNDAAWILRDGLRRAKDASPEAIRAALAETKDLEVATGVVSIDPKRNAEKPLVVVQIERGAVVARALVGPGSERIHL